MLNKYTQEDWGFVIDCYRTLSSESGNTREDIDIENIKRCVNNNNIKIIVSDNKKIGIISFDSKNYKCVINSLFIIKKYRKTKSILTLYGIMKNICKEITFLTKEEHSVVYNFTRRKNAKKHNIIYPNSYYRFTLDL